MRGIRKPQPPHNVSPAGQTARSMHQAHTQLQSDLANLPPTDHAAHARTSFNALEKALLRAVLYSEQHHVCVYCERRVKESNTPPIEHWHPVNGSPQHALDWDNLYLSCPNEGTCDDAKEGTPLGLPWPTQKAYEHVVGFTSGGEIYVRSDAPLTPAEHQALASAISINGTLNLNHSALVASRKAAIDAERKRLSGMGQNVPDTVRSATAQSLLAEPERPPHISIRVAYLTRTLGQGRP